ncbi:MAG: hypothetical protein U9R23_06555 [Candidatus Cloacimonadota bacterium]|nr:hypothetical protein [Candidatus Cloacimonadota bacterium]
MSNEEAISYFLNEKIDPKVNIQGSFSSFNMALYEIRRVTKRDELTGQRNFSYENNSWLGAIGYMSLLDMIGACFKPQDTTTIDENRDFVRALKYFSEDLTEDEMLALYALRCALTHDFSLCNYNPNNPKLSHIFILRIGNNDKVVKLPTTSWDGSYDNRTEDNQTIIDIEIFGDIVEAICKKIASLAKQNKLEIILTGGADELISRFTSSQKFSIKLRFSKDSKISKIKVNQ